jgi:hypothetical protein
MLLRLTRLADLSWMEAEPHPVDVFLKLTQLRSLRFSRAETTTLIALSPLRKRGCAVQNDSVS